MPIAKPSDYLSTLEKSGRVIADFDRRRALVKKGVEAAAKAVHGSIVDGESLYDEVTSLVEWPVPMTGNYDAKYLELPREVVVSTLTGHQRYFPVANKQGELLPHFITVANIESSDPEQVRSGNERVVHPRLADAAFFWDNDRRTSLAARHDALREVVYQHSLGSLADKSARVASLATQIAAALGVDADNVSRAAELSKCDLLSDLVGEFPDLQGTMGRYYANLDGEAASVADAIGEQYHPRFAGDSLPASRDGQMLALADRLDTLAGIFTIGKKPTGNRDPFGLRRAALGVVRLLVECRLDINLTDMISIAAEAQSSKRLVTLPLAAQLLHRLLEVIAPRHVVFCAQGLREGVLYDALSDPQRDQDPLLASSAEIARRFARFGNLGEALWRWSEPLFATMGEGETASPALRRAACLLSDVSWTEHPDYRAPHAYQRMLTLPVMGLDHPRRAFLALAAYARYAGEPPKELSALARAAGLSKVDAAQARAVGHALALGYTVAAGRAAVLGATALETSGDKLRLLLPSGSGLYRGDAVQSCLSQLAAALGLTPSTEFVDRPKRVKARG